MPSGRDLGAFLKEQRERRAMSLERLKAVIEHERLNRPRSPTSAVRPVGLDDRMSGRFPNEIIALRVFAISASRLRFPAGKRLDFEPHYGRYSPPTPTRASSVNRVRIRGGTGPLRGGDPSRALVDYLDLSARLSELTGPQLDILLMYYVFRASAEELAERYSTNPASIGGRLSQARRELRRVLSDLLPEDFRKQDNQSHGPQPTAVPSDPIAERRAKVARFLERRVGYPDLLPRYSGCEEAVDVAARRRGPQHLASSVDGSDHE